MITAYHRPKTLDEALALLKNPHTLPLGGGTLLSKPTPDPIEVVDLQALGLDLIYKKGSDSSTSSGQRLEIGATVTLQELLESKDCPEALKTAIKLEAPLNIRNSATAAGTLVAGDGRSTFVTSLLALDAKIEFRELGTGNRKPSKSKSTTRHYQSTNIGEYLLTHPSGLITSITIPLEKFAFEYVSRTPSDKPVVFAALAQWNSGRTRLALGGYGKTPLLAMDGDLPPSASGRGNEGEGLAAAARNAYHEANDEWASAEFRMDVAATLAKRCLGL